MGNPYACEEGIEFLILSPPPPPIGLNRDDFPIQGMLNMLLKGMKLSKNLIFMLQKKHPSELGENVYETHIIPIPSNKVWGWTPHIRENKLKRSL
jgi:hypothetical protein